MHGRTVYDLLSSAADRYGDLPALHQPSGDGRYRTWSWAEYRRAAEEIAAGLGTLGVGKGDIVGLDSETRAEFYLADLGIMSAGAVAAAVYTAYPAADRARTFRAAAVKAVFVEDEERMRALELDVPCILLTGEGALTLDDLRRRGREALGGAPFHSPAQPADPAILYLTSGATGEPKMALTSHGAIAANVAIGDQVLSMTPDDAMLAFLPSAHITQRLVMELLPIGGGVPVWFSESLLRLPQELESVRPTIFVAPPRLWERIHTSIRIELKKKPALVRRLVDAGLALAHRPRLALHERLLVWAVDRVAFSKMRARFGGRMRVFGSGSAPLGRELAEFYTAIGLPFVEGYGLTEGGIVILNPLDRPRPGSIGKSLPGVEAKLAEDGELLIRSATLFSGYYKDDAATAEVLRDGWLHTGDLAEIDRDGYIYITGRKKELIVSSTGRKIYPSRIESLFHLEPIVSHVLPAGDGLPHLVALITVNEAVANQVRDVHAEVAGAVARVNRKLAPFEQIRRWRILAREFSIEAGELTATLKVRRAQALKAFAGELAELYD